jgi:ubiquinone/menaquinone biosynthesis C-methylase UbiE
MIEPNNNYLAVNYSEARQPFTEYPELLARHLVAKFSLNQNDKLLEVGCGRGEVLRGLIRCGLKCYGVDQSDIAGKICPEAEIKVADLEADLPYSDNSFDLVYSKSVLEHFYHPEKLVLEIYRILRPGGRAIIMTPDWKSKVKTFYDDYTHRTPFTFSSLRDILLIHGFLDVNVERFRQLPFLWKAPWLNIIPVLVGWVSPIELEYRFKFVRFSKQVMLLSSSIKPEKSNLP